MKKTKKLLAVATSFALLVGMTVNTTVNTFATTEPSAQAEDAKYSTYLYDFEEGSTGFAALYGDQYLHANATANLVTTKGTVFAEGADNTVARLKPATAVEGQTVENSDISEMYGPADDIIKTELANNKYLSSGGLDLSTGRGGFHSIFIVLGIDEDSYQILQISLRSNGGELRYGMHDVSREAETTNISVVGGYVGTIALTGMAYCDINDDSQYPATSKHWAHLDFSYNASNKLVLEFKDNTTKEYKVTTGTVIEPEHRIFAVTKPYVKNGAQNDLSFYFDNLELNFIPEIDSPVVNVMYDFEDEQKLTALYGDKYAHAHATATHSIKANTAALDGNTENHTGYIPKATRKTGYATGNMSEMYGPAESVDLIADGKYLVSGSFEIDLGRSGYYNRALIFGMDEDSYQYVLVGPCSGGVSFKNVDLDLNTEATTTGSFSNARKFATGDYGWVRVDFSYDENNELSIKMTNAAGASVAWPSSTLKSVHKIAPKDRVFAISSSYYNTGEYNLNCDNIKLKFTEGGVDMEEPEGLNGDANNDGKIDICDLLRTKRYLANPVIGIMENNMKLEDDIVDKNDFEWLRQYFINPIA